MLSSSNDRGSGCRSFDGAPGAAILFCGIPKAHVIFVQRKGITVERFPAVEKDGTWIRAVYRIGLVFLKHVKEGLVGLVLESLLMAHTAGCPHLHSQTTP